MRTKLEEFLSDLEQIKTLEELQKLITSLRTVYDVDHIVYHSVNMNGEPFGVLTYSEAWVQRYLDQDYGRIDPVVLGCFQRFHPVDWKELNWSTKPAREFLVEAQAAGVGNQGFSIPIRGPSGQFALFTINHSCSDKTWSDFTRVHVQDLILVAHFINQKVLEIQRGSDVSVIQGLSPRELDALTLLGSGMNRSLAAENLSISEHTLRVYIESARFKLGAANTTHAVAMAMAKGLIIV